MTGHLQTYSLERRPDLLPEFLSLDIPWPAFIGPSRLLVQWGIDFHSQHQLIGLIDDSPVARAAALPISWDGDPGTLPPTGWDGAVEQSLTDTYTGAPLNTLCALEVGIAHGSEGQGLSQKVLMAMRTHAIEAGFEHFIAPVRPSAKTQFPAMPIGAYVERRRDDGLRSDDWLRVHERIGGRIIALCPTAMTITASLRQWEAWSGERFVRSGLTAVAGGIAPVFVNVDHDYAAYVEPNVWVQHSLLDQTPPERTKP